MTIKDGFDYRFYCDDEGNLEFLRFSIETGYKLVRNENYCMDCDYFSFSYDLYAFSGFVGGTISFVPENFYDYDRFITYFDHFTEIPIKRIFVFDCKKRDDDPRKIKMAESFLVIEDEDFCVRVTPYSERDKALFNFAENYKDLSSNLSFILSLFDEGKAGDQGE